MGRHFGLLASLVLFAFHDVNAKVNQSPFKIQTRFHRVNDFVRFSEFFTGRENTGNYVIIRSQKERSGLYFYLPLNESKIRVDKIFYFKLSLIDSRNPKARNFDFLMPEKEKFPKNILLGITGEDWAEKEDRLVAWEIKILDEGEKNLCVAKSSLWQHSK